MDRRRIRHTLLCIVQLAGLLVWPALNGCTPTGPMHQPTIPPSSEASGQVRLAWDAPTTRADGTPLAGVAGFKLYYGPTSGTYAFVKTVGNHTTFALSGLEPGELHYVTVTAYDSTGVESRMSDELMVTAPLAIGQSTLLTQDPIRRGQSSRFRVRGAMPHEIVSFLYSQRDEGDGPCSPRHGGLCVDLIEPWVFGEATADASGTATLERTIPADALPGEIITVQALIQRGHAGTDSIKTNAITAIIME